MLLFFIINCLFIPINARSIHKTLLGRSQFDEASLETYLVNFERLSRLHQELNGVEVSHEATEGQFRAFTTQLEQVEPARPDLLPFLFEGDIILTDNQLQSMIKEAEEDLTKMKNGTKKFPRKPRALTSNLSTRWTSFPIPFMITSGVNEAAVLAGVRRWEDETCITFQRVSSPVNGGGLQFIRGDGCYSYIGRTGNQFQQVSIGYGCESLGTVTHEMAHALGFYHEQARSDRDYFVSIITQNIQSTYLSQFSKQAASTVVDYGVTYDYGSVMHYDQTSFSANNGITIRTLDTNYQYTIGQRIGPSFADVKQMNLAYCAALCKNQLNCLNGGYTDPKNCAQCRCPDGYAGTLCNQAAASGAACGPSALTATAQMQNIGAQGAATCNYVITAPAGKKVYFEITQFNFPAQTTCSSVYLELKYFADKVRTGARLCQSFPGGLRTENEQLVVLYRGAWSSQFGIQFRYDPLDSPATVSSSSTTTTTRTTTTTTTRTTTTTQRTTTRPRPTTTRTTPQTTTRQPQTTVPWWLTLGPNSGTTVGPPVGPWPNGGCTNWSVCSAGCGGCGTQDRTCPYGVDRRYCNTSPCPGGFCCRPFIYVIQGFCARPLTDENLRDQLEGQLRDRAGYASDADGKETVGLETTANDALGSTVAPGQSGSIEIADDGQDFLKA